MTRRLVFIALASASLFFAFAGSHADAQSASAKPASSATTEDSSAWHEDLAAWRSQREMEISAADGWLTLAGLEWLKPGINSIGSAPGSQVHLPAQAPAHLGLITINGGSADESKSTALKSAEGKPKGSPAPIIQLLAPAGGFPSGMTVDGKPAREEALAVDEANPSTIAWHGLSMVVLRRGDRFVLRIKDVDSPVRKGFRGLNWYAPDPRYRVTARWIPFRPPIIQQISTVIGTTLKLPAPGLAVFLLDGKAQYLEPVIEDPAGKTLFFILKDPTSKNTTYGGGRFLHASLPDHGLTEPGDLILDFNRLENPPCAYTNFATCPLPPVQNQLYVDLEAGEKRYER
jgi:uncharacterized protein (DUF1684 family)